MAIEKAPKHGGRETLAAIGDQAFLYFQQRHVRPVANETEQIVAMGLYTTGTTISPRRGTVLNFVCGLGTMGREELSHGPTQGTQDPGCYS
jgi:hypothetical protein